LVVAILLIVLAVLAQLAHNNYAVPLEGTLLALSAATWAIIGVAAFIVALIILIVIAMKPSLIFEIQEVTPRTLKPQLHIRCRQCQTVSRMVDTGERPLNHFCPKCGTQGAYGGPEAGEKGFVYTRIEVKLGCTRCHTTFRIPEPLVRPLFAECPNCHAKGVLSEKQRPQDALEVPIRCVHCGEGFHVYDIKSQWTSQFPCPKCGTVNAMPTPA
jgi:predicted RNA-binding Zn-ribbon protein involved in translation (DUF1610 family)